MANYVPFISIVGVAALIVLCIEFDRVRRLVAKILFGTLAVALLVYGACALQNAARAEEEPEYFVVEEFTKVTPVNFNGELCLKLSFKFHNMELAFYWAPEAPEEEYDFTLKTWVKIMFREEVIDCGYVK